MKPYSQETRDRCLGALMASAVLVDGEWRPCFAAVGKEEGISHQTMRRWWRERDHERDVALRGASTRARETVEAEGAEDWTRGAWVKLRDLVDRVITFDEESGEPITMTHQDRAHLSRAAKLVAETLPAVEAALSDEGDAMSPNERIRRGRLALKRTGIG